MPKEIFISRFALIIRRLERGPANFVQIARYLQEQSALEGKDYTLSQRTLQRDIRDIYTQLNIEIVNEQKGDRRYYINSKPETREHGLRLLEGYQLISAINAAQDYENMVMLESRQPRGLEHFYGLLHAIKNKKIVSFRHVKFWEAKETQRTVHPLGLKECQGRWYLLAVDTGDERLKTFGLDRIIDIDISTACYMPSYSYKLATLFTHSFGIICPEGDEPQEVQLQFSHEQGQYVKAYPLHASQKLVTEDDHYLVIELRVYLTYDLTRELLSFGPELKVLAPTKLVKEMRKQLQKALKQYEK